MSGDGATGASAGAEPAGRERKGTLRVVTGILLLPLLVAFGFSPPWACLVLLVIGAAIGCYEMCAMLRALGLHPLQPEGVLLAIALVIAFSQPVWGAGAVLAASIAALPIGYMARRLPLERALPSIGGTLLAILIVGVFLGYLMGLRRVGLPDDPWFGGRLLLFLYLTIFPGDTAAYYVGRALGRHRLAPLVSPKKTWEGLFGGIAGSLAGAALARWLFLPMLPWWHVPILGVGLSVAGAMGDLVMSLLKRSAGVKDTGKILPGHGGMLDRCDGLILAAPAFFYYWKYLVTG